MKNNVNVHNTYFIKESAKCPPVHRLAVALVLQDLWSQVLRCTAESLGASFHARARDAALRKTKVGQTQVTRGVQPKLGKIQIEDKNNSHYSAHFVCEYGYSYKKCEKRM